MFPSFRRKLFPSMNMCLVADSWERLLKCIWKYISFLKELVSKCHRWGRGGGGKHSTMGNSIFHRKTRVCQYEFWLNTHRYCSCASVPKCHRLCPICLTNSGLSHTSVRQWACPLINGRAKSLWKQTALPRCSIMLLFLKSWENSRLPKGKISSLNQTLPKER